MTRQGGRVTIVNRSEARGRRLAEELDGAFVSPEAFTGDAVDILVNTTSVGMTPHVDGLPVPASCLRPGMTVMDIVYNPLQTRLLRSAHEAGCRVVDGVAMFVHQGALQFARWTGEVPPLKRMQETVIDALTLASDQGSQPTDTGASG